MPSHVHLQRLPTAILVSLEESFEWSMLFQPEFVRNANIYQWPNLNPHLQSINYAGSWMETATHLPVVKRILWCVKSAMDQGLDIEIGSLDLLALLSWRREGWKSWWHRSINEFCVYVGPCLVSWGAEKQPPISCSSTKAEFLHCSRAIMVVNASPSIYLCAPFHKNHQKNPFNIQSPLALLALLQRKDPPVATMLILLELHD